MGLETRGSRMRICVRVFSFLTTKGVTRTPGARVCRVCVGRGVMVGGVAFFFSPESEVVAPETKQHQSMWFCFVIQLSSFPMGIWQAFYVLVWFFLALGCSFLVFS